MKVEELINLSIKSKLTPGYIQTLMGMINPKNKGMNSDQTFDPFIEQTDDGKYRVKHGYSIVGKYDTLQKAKEAKKDLPTLTLDTIKQKLGKEYVESEKAARKYVESQGKTYSQLPVKSQFILANYHHTGHKNEDLFKAVLNNNFLDTIKNYQRSDMEQENEFFKSVMFSSPIGENDLSNNMQAQNFANNMLDGLYPNEPDNEMSSPKMANEGAKKTKAVAEFTGGELVNNKEDEMRQAIKSGNNSKAADIFRNEVKDKNITPGEASHKTNPLPVAEDGTVMNDKGKPTGQNAKPGAGVYDHIKKQYKPNMSDDEVIAMVKKNHAKWRKNGMG